MSKYNDNAVRPRDILWETVKTEEEEYLDKLQSKLTRVMDGFRPTPSKETDHQIDPDALPDMLVTQPVTQPQDHDDGLHLMYNYPRPGVDDNFTQPFPSSSQPHAKIDVDMDSPPSRQRTVRFRSRVRITSGIHSVPSSCGSPSSSISVPLQGSHGPSVSTSAAPLSDMVPSAAAKVWMSSLSSSRTASSSRDRHERRRNSASSRSSYVDERTPLASAGHSGSRRSYTEHSEDGVEEDSDTELDRLRTAARKSEEQVMFGKWPWRLLNRHWWWWKIEPIVCCCSRLDDDSDPE